MLRHAMELWGIKDSSEVDPVIDMFLDVFALEVSRLNQEIKKSDTQLLHRLSRILVSNKWSLPMPAHGLLFVYPNSDDDLQLTPTTHFFVEKRIFGIGDETLFFTPLLNHQLIEAELKCVLFENVIKYSVELNNIERTEAFRKSDRLPDFSVWVGIKVSDNIIRTINKLSLCIVSQNPDVVPYLKMMNVYDTAGTKINVDKALSHQCDESEAHYFNDIISYYNDSIYTLDISKTSKKRHTLTELFGNIQTDNDEVNYKEKMFWIKIVFPEYFNSERLDNLKFYINTIPVVNRKLIRKSHDVRINGRIVSLPSEKNASFLNVRKVLDNLGNKFINVFNSNNDSIEGTYSLYFGELESFDSSSAKSLLNRIFRQMKEDGNAFASVNPEAVNTHLRALMEKLEESERIVNSSSDYDKMDRAFLLSTPFKESTNFEIKYWQTKGAHANGFDERSFVQQYNSQKSSGGNFHFVNTTRGGTTRKDEQELTDSLRYGLFTRNRIVSQEDVKCYIKQQIGRHIDTLIVKDGVAISTDKKKGIIRTTEVRIKLKESFGKYEEYVNLAFFFEKELTARSVSRVPYKVIFE